MIIFVFITTPVQLWHYHPPVDQVDMADTVVHAPTNAVHGHCDVCEHQYTVYLHEAADWQFLTPFSFVASPAAPVVVFPHSFLRQDANKGPPARV